MDKNIAFLADKDFTHQMVHAQVAVIPDFSLTPIRTYASLVLPHVQAVLTSTQPTVYLAVILL
jgi:hypothetical protein